MLVTTLKLLRCGVLPFGGYAVGFGSTVAGSRVFDFSVVFYLIVCVLFWSLQCWQTARLAAARYG